MTELTHWGIKGQKWGIRKYQNPDGTLTEAGKKRYSKEITRNNQRKKKDRADEEALKDPNRWVRDDLENTRNVINSVNNLTRVSRDILDTNSKKKRPRLDLSKRSDKDLRDEINRELLERQYNDIFNAPKTNRGKEKVKTILSGAGAGLSLAAAAVSVAVGIQTLKNG